MFCISFVEKFEKFTFSQIHFLFAVGSRPYKKQKKYLPDIISFCIKTVGLFWLIAFIDVVQDVFKYYSSTRAKRGAV